MPPKLPGADFEFARRALGLEEYVERLAFVDREIRDSSRFLRIESTSPAQSGPAENCELSLVFQKERLDLQVARRALGLEECVERLAFVDQGHSVAVDKDLCWSAMIVVVRGH